MCFYLLLKICNNQLNAVYMNRFWSCSLNYIKFSTNLVVTNKQTNKKEEKLSETKLKKKRKRNAVTELRDEKRLLFLKFKNFKHCVEKRKLLNFRSKTRLINVVDTTLTLVVWRIFLFQPARLNFNF